MDWRYNTIWFEQIQPEKKITFDFKQDEIECLSFSNIEYATFWHHPLKRHLYDILPPSNKLLYLELNSANIKDFSGI